MPVHDWTRVDAGIFHDFHNAWITELRNTLNGGLLPSDYYALGEQHAGRAIPDILTLHTSFTNAQAPVPPSSGGIALAEAPPRVGRKLLAAETYRQRRHTLAIRHVSGHRLVAILEIVSPANKDRMETVEEFVAKSYAALAQGIHVTVVDLFPPGRHDPRGMHGAVWENFSEVPYEWPSEERLTVAAYRADTRPEAQVTHLAVGSDLPAMPLFLLSERYIEVPLEATYQAAYRGVPAFWRSALEKNAP